MLGEEDEEEEEIDEQAERDLIREAEEKHLRKTRKRGPYRKSWSGPA